MSILTYLFGQKRIDDTVSDVPYSYSNEYFRDVESGYSIPALIEATRDYSGYIRQAAIARAVKLGHPEFLPALAARLNDWVPQVRDAARSALITLLPMMPQDAVLTILPALAGLHNAGRHDHAAWLETFERVLLQHVEPRFFADGVLGGERKVARACFDLLLRRSIIDTASAIEIGLKSDDIANGLRAAHAIATLPFDAREMPCKAALLSRFGAVRAIGLRGYLHGTGTDKYEKAMERLLDQQSTVRTVAMMWLAANHGDARAYYRQVLESPASSTLHLRISLAALCTFRQRDDAGLVTTFVPHQIVAVRAAAYAAWLKLAENEKDQIALKALGDDSERVKKLAMEMVERHGAYISFASACDVLNGQNDWSRLMRLGGNGEWDALEAMTGIAPSAETQFRAQLHCELISWMRLPQIYARPTAAQAAFLRSEQATVALAALAGHDVREQVERALALALARRR